MNFGEYSTAVVSPVKTTILGITLKPLSLGHFLNMRAFGCNYASDEPTQVDIVDLILGIVICSMSYEDWHEFIDSPKFSKEIRKWGKLCKKATKRNKSFNVFDKMNQFKGYLDAGSIMPYVEPTKQTPSNEHIISHWSSNLNTVLVSKLGFSESRALNMPLTQAFAHYFQYLEHEGVVRINYKPEVQYNAFLEEINKLKKDVKQV